MQKKQKLPKGFEALEGFVEQWMLPDSQARAQKRFSTNREDIKSFYDAMLSLAPQALEHLRQCELGNMSTEQESLLKLMLSLAEVGPAVEWYGDVQATDSFDPNRFPLVIQLPDCAAQKD